MKPATMVRRTIHPEVRVVDEKRGLVEYIASDETIDSYREVIRADGWRFDDFSKNAPFVDSHNYGCIDRILGRVVDFQVKGRQLVETVQWAIDVPENTLAQLGFRMAAAGYLRAVSVGFMPVKMLTRWDRDPNPFAQMVEQMKLPKDGVTAIYLEQQQKELSACVIGANPSAVARAYKAGLLTEDQLSHFRSPSPEPVALDHLTDAPPPDAARERYLEHLRRIAALL